MSDEELTEPTRGSADGQLYWLLVGQFGDGAEDQAKGVLVWLGIATATVCVAAATSALLVTLGNWPVALVLVVVGVVVLVLVWLLAQDRFDHLLFDGATG